MEQEYSVILLKRHGWKLLIPVFSMIVLFILIRRIDIDFSTITMEDIKSKINAYGPLGPVVFIVFYQLRPFILLPTTLFTIAAGVIWGWGGLVVIMIADGICATWEFFVARYFAYDTIRKIVGERIKNIEKMIEGKAFTCVFLVRLVPNVALDIQNLAFGLTKIPYGKYILSTLLGLLPGKIMLIYFGDSFLDVFTNPSEWWKILLIALVSVGMYLFFRKKVSF